jgi:transcriptional regulator with XRE-family HTH domain
MTKGDQDLHLKFNEVRSYRLYLARFKLKLRQAELARDLGVSRFHIMRLEGLRHTRGKTMVALFNWARMQAVMGRYAAYVRSGAGAAEIEYQHRTYGSAIRALLKQYEQRKKV